MYSHLEIKAHDSKYSLAEHLRKCSKKYLILGEWAEAGRHFKSIDLPNGISDYCVGLICSGTGIEPSAIYIDPAKKLIAGHDTSVSCIEFTPFRIHFTIDIKGVFYKFLYVSEYRTIVVHELGLVKLDVNGKIIWKIDTDIVGQFEINEQMDISILLMDSQDKLIINGRTGLLEKKGVSISTPVARSMGS